MLFARQKAFVSFEKSVLSAKHWVKRSKLGERANGRPQRESKGGLMNQPNTVDLVRVVWVVDW